MVAGATVFGYCPPEAGYDAPDALTKVGATCFFTDMGELAALFGGTSRAP